VRCMRVDLFAPEIFVVRDKDADWNILWALHSAPEIVQAPTPPPTDKPVVVPVYRDPFPRNGVHIHDGIVHVIFVSQDGKETEWVVTQVHGSFTRDKDGAINFGPLWGECYGGRVRADTVVPSFSPFVIDMKVDLRGAQVARMIGH